MFLNRRGPIPLSVSRDGLDTRSYRSLGGGECSRSAGWVASSEGADVLVAFHTTTSRSAAGRPAPILATARRGEVRGRRGWGTLTRPQRPVPRRREPEGRSEDSREVRLIGESRLERDLDKGALPVNPLPCEFETAHEQIAVGAGPEHDPELPRQVVACQSRDRLQLLRMHDPGLLGIQELPSPFDSPDVDASGDHGSGTTPLSGHQPVRQVHDEAVHGQRIQRSAKRRVDGSRQPRVRGHRLAHEGQRIGPPAQDPYRVREKRRFHVDDPVAESLVGARASVVDLVRIQHDHSPGSARMGGAAVVENLDAGIGHTDRIRVVSMSLIGRASEPCAEELDATDRARAGDPASDRPLARSFKTLTGRSGFLDTHRSHPGAGSREASRAVGG